MSEIKAIIYDVDGTMVNSEPIHVEAWDKALHLYGFEFANLSEAFRRTMAGKKPIVIAQGMVDELSVSATAEELLDKKSQLFLVSAEENLQGMPGVIESVKRFDHAGYKLGIGTSLDRSYLDLVLSELGVQEYFDVIITGDQIKNGKPHPETYLRVARELNAEPINCLVLEDATSGIISAKSAGSWCIAIEGKDALPQDTSKADLTVQSLDDITLNLVQSITHESF